MTSSTINFSSTREKRSFKTGVELARSILTASAAVLCAFLVPSAHADVFGSGANTLTLEFVTIGNPGNADDAGAGGGSYFSSYGGVSYGYRMGTYEISQDAIEKATAGGLLSVTAGPHTGSQPAAQMTWFEAAAFVNWLNDQRTPGLKAYQLDVGLTTLTPWASVDAWQAGGENLYRHKDAYYFLPSEDEWYKAAYHQNTGVNADYWDYATGSNSIPTAVASGTTAGTAVYNGASPAAVNLAGGLSAYGTMGQNGNVWEWNESALDGINSSSSEGRAVRGGNWYSTGDFLRSSFLYDSPPSSSSNSFGFRVASVPEPTSTVLMISAGLLAIARRRRRATL
jgi:formylglycine-generating enzyme